MSQAKKYHKWTPDELKMLVSKPDNYNWRGWMRKMGIWGKVKYKAAIHRAVRHREFLTKQSQVN